MADNQSPKIDIVATAKKRFKLAEEAENELRQIALDDLKNLSGDQWPDDVKSARAADKRPCLVVNKLPQHVNQIANDQRQNNPSIKVFPVDDKADKEIARIRQGLIRNIEYNSNAAVAYNNAFRNAVESGTGYFRVMTQYCDYESFNQEIVIKQIADRFSATLDPLSVEPDGKDANYGFIHHKIPKDDYIEKYGETKLGRDWTQYESKTDGWVTEEAVIVAEYIYKEYQLETIYLLTDGKTVKHSELAGPLDPKVVKKMRKVKVPKIKWSIINGVEELESGELPGKYIPIIPVYGSVLNIQGKVIREGVIRHAKDPQKMYNYYNSAEAEAIGLAPKAPFIAAAGQIEEYSEWEDANTKNYTTLPYDPVSIDGQLVPPPQRNSAEPAVMAISHARAQAADDIKSTTGQYDASFGNRSNEQSGLAIQRRANQAQMSNYHFMDNMAISMRHAGVIINDWIPVIYDAERTERIIGEDGTHETVKLNQEFQDKDGSTKEYDITAGKYDIVVSTGPSFETRRQEAAASKMELVKADPKLMGVAGDLILKDMDWPGAEEIAERYKFLVPPEVRGEKAKQMQLPPELQQEIQGMQQQIQQMGEMLAHKDFLLNTKKMELESKERIEMAKMQLDASKALLKVDTEQALMQLRAEFVQLQKRLEIVDMNQEIISEETPVEQNLTGEATPGTSMEEP